MDFTLDKKHEMARGLFKDFAENEVKVLQELAVKWVSLNSDPVSPGEVNYKR